MLTLYFSPGACSMAAHIVLEELGVPFEAKPVFLRKGEHLADAYGAINWKRKVPVLDTDSGRLTENVAILSWLAWSNPQAGLFPAPGTFEAAEGLSLMAWFASGVHPIMSRFFGPQKVCDVADTADAVRAIAAVETARNFAAIEKMLAGKEWVLGSFSVADAYLYPFIAWAGMLGLDLEPYPNYRAHHARMKERPSVQRMLAREAAAA